ncbi:MAG: CBS domain-containing protein [Anaerolineales bacterium]|jgi:acetoin utilization protein AcuB
MFVQQKMTKNPVTITTDMSVPDALALMHEKKVHRLPVLGPHGKLVGIVSEADLLYASPSPATTLNVWEMHALLAKLKVEKVMTREVITVTEDTPIEEAARLMAEKKIGGLPVLREKALVGIITETDLFKVFISLFGGLRPGVRVFASIPSSKGTFSKVTGAISKAGGNIVGLGLDEVSDVPENWEMTMKVQDLSESKVVEALEPVVYKILDVREV